MRCRFVPWTIMAVVVRTLAVLLVGVLISRFPRGNQRRPEEGSPDA